jgi:hypothetical protein
MMNKKSFTSENVLYQAESRGSQTSTHSTNKTEQRLNKHLASSEANTFIQMTGLPKILYSTKDD